MSKKSNSPVVLKEAVENRILIIRGKNVILDRDLAALYGVSTKALNQAVKRNKVRFPDDFIFQLTPAEKDEAVTNCDHLHALKYSPNLPYAFTEHGALMAANILNSPRAVRMSLYVIRAFIQLREVFNLNQILQGRLADIEKILLEHDTALRDIYEKIRQLLTPRHTDAIGFELQHRGIGKIG